MHESVQSERTKVFDTLFEGYAGPPFAVRLWDGWTWRSSGQKDPVSTIIFHSAGALRALATRPSEITLGMAYLNKEIDVEGDLFSVFDVGEHIFACPKSQRQRAIEIISGVLFGLGQWWKQGATHSEERDKAAISYHYDQPVDFYRPWLGSTLAYSCAYFETPEDSLDQAETNKLELICRKLRLEPGERFLDIGCGWGGLILHAAGFHRTKTQGITISKEQAATAQTRIDEAGLAGNCAVDLLDYREAPARFGVFDKAASVGMFEHVGLKNMPLYFQTVRRLLKPGGVFLNHGIARAPMQGIRSHSFLQTAIVPFLRDTLKIKLPSSSTFISKFVFPDGELITIAQAIKIAEKAGLEVRDVENLREHYDLTLRLWVKGLRENEAALLKLVPEKVYRIWLLYMAGCAAAFKRGDIAVYQTLLSNLDHGRSGLPLRRSDWYLPEKERETVTQ